MLLSAIGLTVTILAPATSTVASAGDLRCFDTEPTIVGHASSERIKGTAGDDVIVGLGGNDIIFGGEGHDLICGNTGGDTIDGGPGDDSLSGGPGRGFVTGVDGDDLLLGGAGDDTLNFGDEENGDDNVIGGDGNDDLHAGVGSDRLSGNAGDDFLAEGEVDARCGISSSADLESTRASPGPRIASLGASSGRSRQGAPRRGTAPDRASRSECMLHRVLFQSPARSHGPRPLRRSIRMEEDAHSSIVVS